MAKTVFFRGKSLSNCPKGYTTCSDVDSKNVECMSSEQCESLKKQKEKRKKSQEFKRNDSIPSIDKKTPEQKEKDRVKGQEKTIIEALRAIKDGDIIDPRTGSIEGTFDPNDTKALINALKRISRAFPAGVLESNPRLTDIKEKLRFLNSRSVLENPQIASATAKEIIESIASTI